MYPTVNNLQGGYAYLTWEQDTFLVCNTIQDGWILYCEMLAENGTIMIIDADAFGIKMELKFHDQAQVYYNPKSWEAAFSIMRAFVYAYPIKSMEDN